MSEKYAGLTALQENVVKTKEHVEAVRAVLDAQKANVFAYTALPQNPTEGMIIMWVGADTASMTKGGWYQYTEVTPSTDPKTYFWDEITASIDIDNVLDPTSGNPVANSGLTNVIQALQEGVLVIYPSESDRLQTISYSAGQIVTLDTVCYCVAERTWYKVTAIDSSTLAITWSPYNPHIGGEITAGNAIKVNETDGSVNVVTDEETVFIKNIVYYAWKDGSDNLVYTLSMTPNVGDSVYDNTESIVGTVEAYDNVNLTIDVSSVTYVRDNADNFTKTALEGLTPNTSDFDVTGRNLMLDVTQRTFTGTRAEFNALSSAEKSKYLVLNITDEVGQGITVTNTIVNGSMNVPTANAVYNFAVSKTLPNALTLGGVQYTDTNTLLNAIVTLLNSHAYWQ